MHTITKHYLDNTNYLKSPNHGNVIKPKYIIMHYTAGNNMQNTMKHFMNAANKVSAHVIIDRDGTITQLVPFNLKSFHAGTSAYKGLTSLNQHSIGIELVNYGYLKQKSNGLYYAWNGALVPPVDVFTAPDGSPWQLYPEEQLDAVYSLTEALLEEYPYIEDVLDHEMVAPKRKIDCGPAFPLENLRYYLFNRTNPI